MGREGTAVVCVVYIQEAVTVCQQFSISSNSTRKKQTQLQLLDLVPFSFAKTVPDCLAFAYWHVDSDIWKGFSVQLVSIPHISLQITFCITEILKSASRGWVIILYTSVLLHNTKKVPCKRARLL